MKKYSLIIVFLTLISLPLLSQEAIIVNLQNGTKQMERLENVQRLTFSAADELLVKTTAGSETTLPLNDVAKITFGDMISLSVTFAGEAISGIPPQTVDYGKLAARPADPTRANYSFGGWFTDNGTFANEWNFAADLVTQDTTLYAKWTPTTGIEQLTIDNGQLTIYPNPTNGQLIIAPLSPPEGGKQAPSNSPSGGEQPTIEIYDVVGQVVFVSQLSKLSPETTIDISHLANGLYFLKIDKKMFKIIKE